MRPYRTRVKLPSLSSSLKDIQIIASSLKSLYVLWNYLEIDTTLSQKLPHKNIRLIHMEACYVSLNILRRKWSLNQALFLCAHLDFHLSILPTSLVLLYTYQILYVSFYFQFGTSWYVFTLKTSKVGM